MTVNAVNDAPVPTAQSVSVNEDTQLSITLAGTDPEGNNITAYALASNPSKGTASLSGNTVTYTPSSNFNGSDSFTFTTSDANATSSAATVSITVNAVNDTPVATSRSVSVEEDVQSPITLTGSDIDGDNLTYALASSPSKGTASLSGNTVTYTPNTNYSGSDSFTFKVSDGSATSSAATVSITVEAALLKFAMNVISNEPVAVEFRETISGWGSQNVSVHGSQHGRLDGSYSGSSGKAFNFQTSDTFFPGEKIAISISSGLTNGDGEKQSRPYLWSYVRPTSSSPAKFDVAMHDLEARSSDTRAFALGDLDGDGYLDVVAGNHEQSGRAYFFNGLDWFVRDVSQGSNGPVRAVLLADWDNDGDLDGVLGMDGSNHLLLKNNGQPTPVGVGNLANNADTRGMAIGDIDGDGDIDLITANFGSENLIYVNNGSFNFASPIVLDNSGDSTMDLAMADLDADGDLDVVTAENGSVNKIFGNDSAGVFSAAGSVVDQGAGSAENSTQTYAVKISDIDGDGEPDGVFGNYNTPNTVFLSKTDTWSSIGSTTMQTARLELGDLDGDGDQDVVVGNYNKKNQVYLFDPSATNKFVVRDLHSDVDNTWALGLGDLDHDGDLDVLTTATGGQGQSVNRIYYNSSSPLAPRIVSVSPAPWSSKSAKNTGIGVVFSESVNGSGGIVAHGSQSGRVAGSVTGNGTGSRGLVPQTPFFPGETVSYTLSSTLVSVANNQPLAAGIIGQYQTKTEAAPAQFDRNLLTVGSEANNTNRLAVADVNGDGRLDVVSGNGGSDTRVYFGEGNGAFEDLWKLHESNGVNGGSTGKAHLYFNDTNAKTKEEFIEISRQRCESGLEDGSSSPCIGFVVNYTNAEKTTPAHSKFKLPGGSLFESETRDAYLMTNAGLRRRVGPGGETKSLSDLVVADVTGDGHIDILSVRDQQAVRIYAGNGNGSYSSFVGMNGFVRPTRALAVGDVDLDGDLDLIEGNDGALSRYYLNGGSGNYGNGHNLNDVARKTQVMVVADVNGDGQPDVIEGNDQSVDRIYWGSFKKTSSALFRRSENISDGSFRTRSISVGDLNADGLADLIVGHKDAADQVFVNSLDGSGLGLKNVIGSNSSPTSSVVLGDVDGDGDLDVLRGLYGQLSLCHLNDGTGVFGPDRPTDGVVHNTTSFALGDIDGDGDIDLAEGIYGERNRLHFNSTEVNATRIVFSTQPGGARYGLPFERPPVVTAQNLNGVTASNLNGLSVELKSSVGNVSNGVVKMTGGVAIFDELTLGIVSSDVTLTATTSVSGLGAETSAKFSVDRAPVSFSVVPKKIGYSGSTVVPKVLTDPPDISFSTKLEGIRGYPKAPGNYRLEVVSTDQNYIGQETLIFTIEPPPAPRATLVSSTTSGPIPLEVEFQGKSSGYFETKSLDTGAGQIIDMTGGGKTTVVYDKPGVYTVVYQVSGPGGKAAAELTIDVAGPPKPQAIPNGVTVEDSPLSIDLAGVDVQSGRWTVYGADPELVESIKVAGDLVTFVPVPDAFGSTDVQVIRTSSLGLTAKQVISLTWTPKDDPPTFNEMPSVFSADEDENLRIDVGKFANDIDSEVGEFKWSIEGYDNALVNSVVVKGSSLMVTPKPDKVGQTKAILRVVDPTSGAEAKQPVNLVWIPINDPPTEPVVGSPANGATEVPLSTMLSWKAEDPDGDLLVYDVFFGEEGKKPEASLGQKAMNFSAVAMKPGTAYVWRVVVRDPSGETTQATARFSTEADKVAPRIRGLTAAVVDEGARIVWETDEEAKFTLSYVSKSSKDGSPPDVGQITDPVYRNSFEVNLPTLQPATFYSLTVVATDRFGNTSKPASGGLRTLAAPDLIAPVITPGSVQVNGISEEGAWVRWATDELSSATLSYELIESDPKDTEGTGSKSGVVESITLARSHALQLNGLKSASLYSFEVFSTDASGNISSAVIGGFKTALGADVIPPTFARAPDIQAQVEEAKIAFRADEVVVAEVRYDVDDSPQDGRVVLSSAPSQGHFLTVEGLEPATKYTYQVAIEDLGGNQTLSKVRSFQTRAAPDKTEPFVEGWRVVPSTERAVLEFAFDEPISASVSWWPEADAENILFLDITDPSPRHSVSLGNLEAATVYRYEITATDAAGNTAAPVSDGFETEAAPDTESPVVLNALVDAQRLESTVLRVDLDEVATLKVDWELTGLPEGVESGSATIGQINSQLSSDLVDAHRISLTKLVPGGYYKALFVAIDPYENMTKGEVLFRAPLRPDTEPPQLLRLPSVLSVSEAGARIGVKYNEDVQLSVRYYLSEDPSAPEIRNFAKPQKKHAFKLNGLQSGVEYTVELLGRDAADLTNERSLSFVTLTEKDDSPPVFTKLPWVESADLAGLRLGLELDEPVVATLNLQSVENPEETHSLSAVERAKSHALEITGLSSGTQYNYVLDVDDANRNRTTKRGQVRTLKKIVAPRIVEGPTRQQVTDDRAWIAFKTNVPARAEISYFQDETPEDVQIENPSTRDKQHVVQLTNLLPGSGYQYSVIAIDDKSGLESELVTGSFRTVEGPDETPPKIQGAPTVASIADMRAKIVWRTDEPSDSRVQLTDPEGQIRLFGDAATTAEHVVELTNLDPGTTYDYTVFSRDLVGNETASSLLSLITLAAPDESPPKFARKPILRTIAQDQVVLAFSADEPASATVEVGTTSTFELGTRTLADQVLNHEVLIDGLLPGTEYFLRVGLTDALGNGPTYAPVVGVITALAPDEIPPQILTGPFSPPATQSEVVIEWTTDEPATRAVRYWIEGQPETTAFVEEGALAQHHRLVLSNLEPGTTYEYVASSVDKVRNGPVESGVGRFRTASRPQLPSFTVEPVAEVDESSGTITWQTNVPSNTVVDIGFDNEYGQRIEKGELVQDHELVISNLEAGQKYHFKVTSTDMSGNVLSTDPKGYEMHSRDLTFRTLAKADVQPPRLIENPTTVWTDKSVVVSWETDEASTSRIEWIALSKGVSNAPTEGFVEDNQMLFGHSLTLTGLSPRTLYLVRVISEDAAGNQMIWEPGSTAKLIAKRAFDKGLRTMASGKITQPPGGAGLFVTDSFPDTRFPVITSGPRVREKTSESVTIEWHTDELSDSFVLFGAQEDSLQEEVGSAQDVQLHSVTLTNLDPGTSYFFRAASTDPSGNGATESGIAVATTSAGADLTPPAYLSDPDIVLTTDVQATIAWTSDEAAAATIEYAPDGGIPLVRNLRRRLVDQQVTLTNLEAGTDYTAFITLRDVNQNETPVPFQVNFTTDAEPDRTPPRLIVNPYVKVLGDESAIIAWETDELADSFVDFDTTPYMGLVTGDPLYKTEHEIRLTNLQPGMTYFFRAGSSDRAQNGPSESEPTVFTTLTDPDLESPAVPSGITVLAGPSAALLEWEPSEAVDFGSYTVYRENSRRRYVAVATGLVEPRYLDESLENGKTYRYRVTASDAQYPANESPQSEKFSVVPDANILGDPPTIFGLEMGVGETHPIVVVSNTAGTGDGTNITYTVQISTEEDFSTIVDREGGLEENASGLTRWRVTRSLDPNTPYWYRVRSNDGRFDGVWSEAIDLKAGDAQPTENSEDFDGDGLVSFRDFFALASGYGSNDAVLDLNAGGTVDEEDVQLFKGRFGRSSGVKSAALKRVEVADGSYVQMTAEATSSDRITLRIDLKGIERLSGYGLNVSADPPILKYLGRADSSGLGGRKGSISVVHDGAVLAVAEHLRGLRRPIDVEDGWSIELLFSLEGRPQDVELSMDEGYIGIGRGEILQIQKVDNARVLPYVYALYPNYPNPFNPMTTIRFSIPKSGSDNPHNPVMIELYNTIGQMIRSWDFSNLPMGYHNLLWDGQDKDGRPVASGVYFIRMRAENFVQVRKATLLR
ncbi:MAG: FG-GAP-like repeat-containing protein [Candidatus Latescibacterota bacterium]|nr:FG-GAP-like repeat-containing protein [Candidatus Latescibacterota bacterium]